MSAPTLTLFAAVLKTVARELKREGLPATIPDPITSDHLNRLKDALGDIEDAAREAKARA